MLSVPVLLLPLAASAPVQPPVAVQAVALVELQVNVDAAPPATVVMMPLASTLRTAWL